MVFEVEIKIFFVKVEQEKDITGFIAAPAIC
jgi:hypothetical protein